MKVTDAETPEQATRGFPKTTEKTTVTSLPHGGAGVNGATSLLAFAQWAGNLGFSVVPTVPGEKRPFGAWKVYQTRLPTHPEIERWFTTPDVQGIGVITGVVSENLEALDFDSHQAFNTFCELTSRVGLGELWERVLSGYLDKSPRGNHTLYRCPVISGNQKLASIYDRDDFGEIKRDFKGKSLTTTLIETRGEGGFLIVPPSFGSTHPTGLPYQQVRGGLSTVVTISPEEREWLLDLARSLSEVVIVKETKSDYDTHTTGPEAQGTRPGDLFNARATWGDVLLPHGWVTVFERNGVLYWRRPGKDIGVSATTNYAGSDLLYVFSTNSDFESERGYSKFSAYARLNHGGDFGKAAAFQAGWSSGFVGGSPQGIAENGVWPDPEEFPRGLLPVPGFAEELIPLSLRPWLMDIAERLQCPPEYPVVGAIVALAAAVGRRIGIAPKKHDDWLVIPNLWGAVVGRPGLLKTPALSESTRPLWRLETQAHTDYEAALARWEVQGLIVKARHDEAERSIKAAVKAGKTSAHILASINLDTGEDKEPTAIRYIVNDPTVEKLGVLLNENPHGLLLFRDELTGWLRTLDRDGHENDRAFFLESWNGNGSYIYDRIGRGTLRIKAACVSILGGIQPGPLSEYLRAAARGGRGDDGLVQRFQILVFPDDPGEWKNVDRWPDNRAKDQAFSIFQNLATLSPSTFGAVLVPAIPGAAVASEDEVPFLRFIPPAQEFFDDWRADLENRIRRLSDSAILEAHLSKYRSLVPSLALIFHLAAIANGEEPGGVTLESVQLAAGWGDFLEEHAKRIYQSVTQGTLFAAQSLAKRISAGALSDPFSLRDIYRKEWSGLTDPTEVQGVLKILEDYGWVRGERTLTAGRPKFQYRINPNLSRKEGCA